MLRFFLKKTHKGDKITEKDLAVTTIVTLLLQLLLILLLCYLLAMYSTTEVTLSRHDNEKREFAHAGFMQL